ncbi:E3 ubiquitin-protein ligase hyd-like, partial [Agrilus planipennis]|uniref:E3 ubiquitin-protein ligase hyd-like n=1 Tax=Agrilus planipennis TaxID=224129 RepID=A0A7F5RHG0_AGRPL
IIIRQIAELLSLMQDLHIMPSTFAHIDVTQDDIYNVQIYLEFRLKATWDWLLTVMDATEAQLRFGASLTHSEIQPGLSLGIISEVQPPSNRLSGRSHGFSNTNSGGTRIIGFTTNLETNRTRQEREGVDAHSARREFLSYCLSLMRAHNSEHLDSLPILDVSALKHVAYVFDALIYYMRSGNSDSSDSDNLREGLALPSWNDQDENENDEGEEDIPVAMETESLDDQEVSNLAVLSGGLGNSNNVSSLGNSGKGRKHSFFQVRYNLIK